MNRTALCLVAASLLLSPLAALPAATPPKPNIVYILADDLGYGDVQCFNPERGKIKTPNMDRLAGQGMSFIDMHGGASVCTPTRYGILTGRYCWRSRLQSSVMGPGDDTPLIARNRLTVPGLMRKHGYQTAAIGKWHLGFTAESATDGKETVETGKKGKQGVKGGLAAGTKITDGPITRGFDYFLGFPEARRISLFIENDRVIESVQPKQMLPRLTQRASQYVSERGADRKPFFLYLALNSPHTPIVPTAEWQGKSGLGSYGDYVMETDWAVGEVLKALDAAGVADNTLVIFTSDNGCSPEADVEALEQQGHFPSWELRGYKSDIWDGGHRIPFIARWPGRIKAGSRSRQLACLTDLMATCAELVGEKLPDNAGEDSVSILPALLGADKAPLREAVVHHSINGRFAIRQDRWKLELCPGSGGWGKPGDPAATRQGAPSIQLYDMAADLGEAKNLRLEQKEVVAKLEKLLEKYVADGRSTPGAAQKNDVKVNIWKGSGKPAEDAGQ